MVDGCRITTKMKIFLDIFSSLHTQKKTNIIIILSLCVFQKVSTFRYLVPILILNECSL